MTEKRFELIKCTVGGVGIQDKTDGYVYDLTTNLESLLNSLVEENEELKKDAKQVLFILSCAELDFKLSVNEAKAIKRLNEYVDGCFNTEKLGDVE